jgi:5-keto-L-gluconate epimerase
VSPVNDDSTRQRLSIVVSTQSSQFSAMSYSGELTDTFARIANMGFDGVELAIRDPRSVDNEELLSLADRTGLKISAIGTGQAFVEEGLLLTSARETTRGDAIRRLLDHLELARRAGAVLIIGLIGTSSLDGQSPDRARKHLIAGLRTVAAEAATVDVRLAVEAVNRYESPLLNTAEAGLQLLEDVGAENVGLLLDTFHMNIEERSMAESIRSCGSRLFHFHVADSNRHHPGGGHLDFGEVLSALRDIRYGGFVSGEFLPLPTPDESARLFLDAFSAVVL